MTNKLDYRAKNAHRIEPALHKIFSAICAEVTDMRLSPTIMVNGNKPHIHSGFVTDAALMVNRAPDRHFLFVGHFKQGGGYRIYVPARNDGKIPTHVLRIQTGDEGAPEKWSVLRGVAKQDKELNAVLDAVSGGVQLNSPNTPPERQLAAVTAVILHALDPHYNRAVPARAATRLLGNEQPAVPSSVRAAAPFAKAEI